MATRKKNKKNRRWWLWLLIGVLLIGGAFALYKSNSEEEGIEVTLDEVNKKDILETVSASGRIFPEKEVKISSDVSGEIVELYVMEGDSVTKGQLLAKIDPDAYVSAVERGKAAVNSAKAQISISKSQEESSKAQKEQLLAQLSNAKNIYERNRNLHKDGVISDVELEQSKSNLESLEANIRASEASIRSAQQSTEGAEYNAQSAAASLSELKTNLSRTTIKAPASGVISSLSIEQGERVVGTMQMTGTELMRISNLNSMEVQVDVSENDIVKVELGDSVSVNVDAYIDRSFRGTITEIANSASNLTGALGGGSLSTDQVTNFPVKIRILPASYQSLITPSKPYPFRPGMSASVDIFTDIAANTICVPIQSVTTRAKEDDEAKSTEFDEVVFVMEADSAKAVVVKSGIQDDEYIQITSGLNEGLEIISGPYNAVSKDLNTGEKVRIKEDNKENKKNN